MAWAAMGLEWVSAVPALTLRLALSRSLRELLLREPAATILVLVELLAQESVLKRLLRRTVRQTWRRALAPG